MKILITGGAGFIGFNLIKLLKVNFPLNEIIVVDNLSTCSANANYFDNDVRFIKDELANLSDYTKELKNVDLVFHLAAKGNVIDSINDPIDNFQSNVFETIKLLEFMRTNGIDKLIFSSTGGAIMGNAKPPVNEKNLPSPISPYGASKLSCEAYLRAYSISYNIRSLCFRFGNVYGPYSRHKIGVINKYIDALKNDKKIKIYGDGNSSRDYIYVEDIVNGLLKGYKFLLESDCKFEILHLASGKETSLNKLIKILEEISDKNLIKSFYPERVGEVINNFADYSLAKEKINFVPSISIKEGLKMLYQLEE